MLESQLGNLSRLRATVCYKLKLTSRLDRRCQDAVSGGFRGEGEGASRPRPPLGDGLTQQYNEV